MLYKCRVGDPCWPADGHKLWIVDLIPERMMKYLWLLQEMWEISAQRTPMMIFSEKWNWWSALHVCGSVSSHHSMMKVSDGRFQSIFTGKERPQFGLEFIPDFSHL